MLNKKVEAFRSFLQDIIKNRAIIGQLVRNDLKARYAGNSFGIFWAYVQPLVNMLVMWFVFQVGFRNSPVDDIEFILWYLSANIPWIFFNDGILSASNCLSEYSYLVKKMRFRTSMLPVVKVLSAAYLHVFFMFFACLMFEIYGYQPQWTWFQIIYYSFALLCLMVGLSWIVASVSVFFKDFSQLVAIVLSIQFWLTPVFWAPAQMSERFLRIFKLNPLYYIANGYRESLIYGLPFWNNLKITGYYWGLTAVVFVVGALLYNRLRPHFADML